MHSALIQLSKSFPNRRAFITGAGSGLGFAFAKELARGGWTVAITDVSAERLKEAADSISSSGGTVIPYEFDVADYKRFHEAVSNFEERYGGIDIGINNAGLGCGGYLHELPIETFRRVIEVNLMGVANGCHLFVPIMKRQRSGHILNVASAAAFVSAPRMSAYNTSKAGVLALSETLRNELSEDNVLVSVLMPTYVRTNIGNDALGSSEDIRLAKMFVAQAELTAEEVVRKTFEKMAANELYIVLPADAKIWWRLKRFMPDRFGRFITLEAKRRIAKMEAAENP